MAHLPSKRKEGYLMEDRKNIRPLTQREKDFATEKYHLITDFLKRQRLDAEEFYDVVVFDFLLAVETYLNNEELQRKCEFEAVAYMYMKRAIFVHFRKQKAQKRSSEAGADISLDSMNDNIGQSDIKENVSMIEYRETVKEIMNNLTEEQQIIFSEKLDGYSLKEIADHNGIDPKRVYKQFTKVKSIVSDVMEIKQKIG